MSTDFQTYLDAVDTRLRDGGFQVAMQAIGGRPTLTGYRADFRWRWMATKLHLFVCAQYEPVVTVDALEAFTRASAQYAKDSEGAMRGLQSGVAAIGVLVGHVVEPAAAAYARTKLVRHFASIGWPAAIDLSTGERFSQQGRPKLGGIYTGWMKKHIDLALPLVERV